jgi:large subunit ribosomal protein L10e
MVSLRKASSYSKKKVRPYTRKSKKRQKSYIKAVPQMKVVKWHMGNLKAERMGKHPFLVKLVAEEKVLVRDNALEACRTYISKLMEKEAPGQFSFSIVVYPHHILRENKTAAGAGADRLSSGMKHSFGITIGRAAIVHPGKEIFKISCENDKTVRAARSILGKIKPKIPCKTKVLFEKVEN